MKTLDSIKPDYQFVRFECPSCGHVWTSSEAIERTDAAWLRFCGSPQVICPQCHGHSDPGDCFCGFHDDGPAWIDPAVTPHPSVCGDVEQLRGSAPHPAVLAVNDPHGRDPEEGTSRPYPWETAAGTLAEGKPHPMVPFPTPRTSTEGWAGAERSAEMFIPVSPIGVPPAPDCGIIDDLEENE